MSQDAAHPDTAVAASCEQARPAVRAVVWTIFGYGAGQLLRLGSNLVLAHLLFPEAFGLMALVSVVLQGLNMFSDLGIGQAIIQSKRGEDAEFINTAWTIQVIRGLILSVCAALIAWPLAWLFSRNDPSAWQLIQLLPVVGFVALFSGFNSTALFTLTRKLALGRLTALTLTSQVVSIGVMIGWALAAPSVWALVAGALAGTFVRMCLSHLLLPRRRNRFSWHHQSLRDLIAFGKWLFVSTVLTFFAIHADRLLLGNLVPIKVLGVYSIGVMLASAPQEIVERLSSAVMFPALSSCQRLNRNGLPEAVRRMRSGILPIATVAVLGVLLLAPMFFETLYDERYHDAGWMAQLVCISVWCKILTSTSGCAILAIGETRAIAACNGANLFVTVIGCVLGFLLFGVPGVILGYAAGTLAGLTVIQLAMWRAGMPTLPKDLKYSVILGMWALIGLGAESQLVGAVPGSLPVIVWQLTIAIVVLVACSVWALSRAAPVLLRR